ncbi:MAG: SURF1 family protein [Gemmatimonadaceae bacterium]
MPRRSLLAILAAVLGAALFVRLGFWQLDRLAQRRALNAAVVAQAGFAPVVPDDSMPRYRHVLLDGSWDFAHEFASIGRTYHGSPGVDVVTPIELASGRTLLVNRGWVYAADAATADLAKTHEADPSGLIGYVEPFPRPASGAADEDTARARRTLAATPALQRDAGPALITSYYVVALPGADSLTPVGHPARRSFPTLDEGPHAGYAVQWFSFALIAVVGVSALLWQDMRKRRRATSE